MRTVSFELAQKLASIGFDEYTPNAYANKTGIDYSPLANDSVFMTTIGKLIYNYEYCDIDDDELKYFVKAPSYAQVLAWFRKHDIDIMIDRSFSMTKSYHYVIVVDGDFENQIQQVSVPNRDYHDAARDAINHIIDNNLLKKK